MIGQEYRTAFQSFVKNGSIGPFSQKRELSSQEVDQELKGFQESRDKYVAFDQGSDDKNPAPNAVKVATSTAFPGPELTDEQKKTQDFFNEALGDMVADTSNDFLHVTLGDKQVDVEETGLRQGVSFTRTEGADTYYMNVTFAEATDQVEALHLNSETGQGTIEKLQYVLPDENEASGPEGVPITTIGGGATIREDADGVLRFDF